MRSPQNRKCGCSDAAFDAAKLIIVYCCGQAESEESGFRVGNVLFCSGFSAAELAPAA